MTAPTLIACATCRKLTLPDDDNGTICRWCGCPYAKGAWRSFASEHAESLPVGTGFGEPTRPGVCLDIALGSGTPFQKTLCARCGYASCTGSPCAVFDGPPSPLLDEMAGVFPTGSFGGIPFPTRRVDIASALKIPASHSESVLVREQAGVIAGLQSEVENWKAAYEAEQAHWFRREETVANRIAWSLFTLETLNEVKRVAEGQGNEHHIRTVMWARRTELRERCLTRAKEIANWMVFDPTEVKP